MCYIQSDDATKACAARWKIEQYHREVKQLTGIAKCQARNARAQRKHIITAILAWVVLNAKAHAKSMTMYERKHEPLKIFQANMWRQPHTVFNQSAKVLYMPNKRVDGKDYRRENKEKIPMD